MTVKQVKQKVERQKVARIRVNKSTELVFPTLHRLSYHILRRILLLSGRSAEFSAYREFQDDRRTSAEDLQQAPRLANTYEPAPHILRDS